LNLDGAVQRFSGFKISALLKQDASTGNERRHGALIDVEGALCIEKSLLQVARFDERQRHHRQGFGVIGFVGQVGFQRFNRACDLLVVLHGGGDELIRLEQRDVQTVGVLRGGERFFSVAADQVGAGAQQFHLGAERESFFILA